MEKTRHCTKCGYAKPLAAFSKAVRGKYGRRATCRDCVAEAHKASYVPRPRRPRREPFTGDELKTCTKCGAEKPVSQFNLSRSATATRNAVYRPWCRECQAAAARQWNHDNAERSAANQRKLKLAKFYGMTLAVYDTMVRDQGGVCAICRQPPSGKNSRERRLVVDHCHESGINRGLLCNRCNRALGLLGDDPITLRRAITYLMQHRKLAEAPD